MAIKTGERKRKELTMSPDIDWSKCDIQKFCEAWAKIAGDRANLKVKVKVYERSALTPEQIEDIERHNEAEFAKFEG